MPSPPKVFLSYSHDSEDHARRVLELSNRLREDGIDCVLDQYESRPSEGWPRWMVLQVAEADFVLVVATATYKRRAGGDEEPGVGRRVNFESILIVQDFYEADMGTGTIGDLTERGEMSGKDEAQRVLQDYRDGRRSFSMACRAMIDRLEEDLSPRS